MKTLISAGLISLSILQANKTFSQSEIESQAWAPGQQKIINGNAILRIKGDNENVAGAIYNITNIGYETFTQVKNEVENKASKEMWTPQQKNKEQLTINKNTKGGRVTLYVERITIDEANTNMFTLIVKDSSDNKEFYRKQFTEHIASYNPQNTDIWWNYGVSDIPVTLKGKIHIYVVDSFTSKVFEFEVSL